MFHCLLLSSSWPELDAARIRSTPELPASARPVLKPVFLSIQDTRPTRVGTLNVCIKLLCVVWLVSCASQTQLAIVHANLPQTTKYDQVSCRDKHYIRLKSLASPEGKQKHAAETT